VEELEADNARMKKEMDSGKAEQRKKVSDWNTTYHSMPMYFIVQKNWKESFKIL